MIVDVDCTPKPYEEWSVRDWPETYQNPSYKNILLQELHLRLYMLFLNRDKVEMEKLFRQHHQEQVCLRVLL
jgi:hypothetical protein